MTPKAKAFNLYFKFIYDVVADHEKAKVCALILVNEMIDNCDNSIVNEFIRRGAISYWQEVKQEILAL